MAYVFQYVVTLCAIPKTSVSDGSSELQQTFASLITHCERTNEIEAPVKQLFRG